jgi:hypothetical protein
MALITTATINNDLNASTSDLVTGVAVGATAFIYNTSDDTGQDTLALGKNDSLLTTLKIYDSNDDWQVQFNSNTDTVQADRISDGSFAGDDTIKFTAVDGRAGIRYLGERDGYFVYADMTVRTGVKALGLKDREGTVNDDAIAGSGVADGFFYDTALGLNLGNDTITAFAANDRLVTTTEIFDSNGDGKINFSGNKAVDLPGDVGNESGSGNELGGIASLTDMSGKLITALYLVDTDVVNGVTYYQYGTTPLPLDA